MWRLPSDQPLAQVDVEGLPGAGQCGLPAGLPSPLGSPSSPLFLATVLLFLFGSSPCLWSPQQ